MNLYAKPLYSPWPKPGIHFYERNRRTVFKKIEKIAVKIAQFLFNPCFLLCFGIGWLITNGWSYILLGIGTLYEIKWMIVVATAYLTFLWLPVSPEKIVTVAIAMFLLKRLFPNDQKTLGILRELHAKVKKKRDEKKSIQHNEEKMP